MTEVLRETYDFTTSSGVVVKIKSDITGREKRAIDHVLFSEQSFALKSVENQEFDISGSILEKYNESIVTQLIVSVGEKVDAVLDAVLDLPAKDCQEIFTEVQRKFQELSGNVKKKNN